MTKYLLRRLFLLVPTLIGMSLLIFLMLRIMPGDIVDVMVGMDPTVTEEAKNELRKSFNLDKPIPVQYVIWVGDILQGDLGKSFRTGQQITDQFAKSLPITLELAGLALLLSVVVALPLGVISAMKQNGVLDFIAHIAGLIGLSFPSFWLGTMFLLVTSLYFHWVPPVLFISPLERPLANLTQMILPALAISVQLMAIEMRMARTSMLEVLRQDYIRTARSKGLRESIVMIKHALKNAMIPVVTVVGLQIGGLMGGSIITEQIFGLPGVGWYMLQGIYSRDFPVVQVTSLFIATIYVVMNLLVDITYAYLDPRIRYA